MTLCRTCRQDHPAVAPQSEDDPEPESDHRGVLLLRVWRQDDDLRCRLLSVSDSSSPPKALAAAQGIDAICDAVRRWLLQL
jgi:hypothetical protein